MLGSLGSGSQMRPGGMPAAHQQRPVQSSLRPPASAQNNQTTGSQVSVCFLLCSLFYMAACCFKSECYDL